MGQGTFLVPRYLAFFGIGQQDDFFLSAVLLVNIFLRFLNFSQFVGV